MEDKYWDLTEEEWIAVGKREEDCTDGDRWIRAREKRKVRTSFVHFLLHYVKIVQPPTPDDVGGVIPFDFWEHLKKAVRLLLSETLIVWLKSRQIGASWLVAAYVLWYALTHVGAMIILQSRGEIEANELLAKCYRIYGQLPDFLKVKLDPDSKTEMGFPVMMSSIKALASTESAGISFAASIIVTDEWEEHPYADENFTASKPTRDAGGQFIGIFTVNKRKPYTLAKAVFRSAMVGENGFIWNFDPWWVRPGRDEHWYEETKRSIPPRELAGLSPELYMEQNYPSSIEEALRTTQTVSAFNLKALDEMMTDVGTRTKVVKDGIDSNIVNIYKDYHLGDSFIAATDTSHGVGKDYSVSLAMNVKTGEVVADIMSKHLAPEELAMHTVKMLDIFGKPLWYIEANDWGGVTISAAQTLRYKRLGCQDPNCKKIGFLTDNKTRPTLWGELIAAINNRQIIIHNADGLRQFYDVIRNAEKGGRIEAGTGGHDDYPMAMAIAWYKKDEVSTGQMSMKPLETLHFARR